MCSYLPFFYLYMPFDLSEDGVFALLNALKLIFVLPVWDLVTHDLATVYLEA